MAHGVYGPQHEKTLGVYMIMEEGNVRMFQGDPCFCTRRPKVLVESVRADSFSTCQFVPACHLKAAMDDTLAFLAVTRTVS